MEPIHVVGLGMNQRDLPRDIAACIETADVLVGGQRFLDAHDDHPARKIPIKSPLDDVFLKVKQEVRSGRHVVVLADGDPGFFGIGKWLVHYFGKDRVVLHPNVTVLQAAASRMKIPCEEIHAVSFHGRRDIRPLLSALTWRRWVGVFTDSTYHPARIAQELATRHMDGFRMHIFENLCQDDERIGSYGIHEAGQEKYSPLNFVIFEKVRPPQVNLHLGLEDHLYKHEKGLITKKEVRAVGLAMLEIEPHHCIWDLGAGCGSVAIEASFLARGGMVMAVEKNANRCDLIRHNIKITGAFGVEVIHGKMPVCLNDLPDPERIFFGGGLGRNLENLEEAVRRLNPGGRMVFHLVLISSLNRVRNRLLELKWPVDLIQVQISRTRELAGDHRLDPLNPVFIVGTKKPPK